VAVSGLVALTLTPMMCSRILKAHGAREARARPTRRWSAFFVGMNASYRRSLGVVLRYWWAIAIVFVLVVASAALLYSR
jgi:multidrug efflux pump